MLHRSLSVRAASRLGVIVTSLLAGAGAGAVFGAEPLVFELDRYNKQYTGLVAEVEPIARGPITIELTSPENDLTVLGNRMELEPAGNGQWKGRVWARFLGEGQLIGEIKLGAFPARFEDRVTILEQERELAALVTIEPGEGGYLVTLEELPETVSLAVESELGSSLVDFCKRFSVFLAGGAACAVLEDQLANPRLPLPEPGTEVFVRGGYFTEDERRRLDDYLAAGS